MSEAILNDGSRGDVDSFFWIENSKEDPHTRRYHSRLRLLDEGYQGLAGHKGVIAVDDFTPLPSVLKFVLDVDGVSWARITAYYVDVTKSPVYSWLAIDSKLCELWAGIIPALVETTPANLSELRSRSHPCWSDPKPTESNPKSNDKPETGVVG